MPKITEARIAILATDGFEQSELEKPLALLREKGATVHVVSLKSGEIKGWDQKDWGNTVPVDKTLSEVSSADYDALVLPGGQINPDLLRVETAAVDFVRKMYDEGKVVAAICHAPWLLVEAGVVNGRKVTSYASIRTDVENAGGQWQDSSVVADKGLVTSRKPEDIPDFVAKIVEEIEEGRHERAAA